MASDVRFAAITPARRATSTTPPFFRRPDRARRRAAGDTRMRPSATASRTVVSLSETSTMRAAPAASRWVRRGRRSGGAVTLEEVAEEDRGGALAGFRLRAFRKQHDERVRARVGHHVGRARGADGPGHEPPAFERDARRLVGLA